MMNKQDILKKIGNIINELNEQYQYLSNTSKINILELELFTANADFLIDHIEILKKINDQVPQIAAHTPAKIENIVVPQVAAQEEEEIQRVASEHDTKDEVVFDLKGEDDLAQEEEKPAPLFKFDFEEPTEMVFDFEKKVAVEDVFDRTLTPEEQQLIDDKKKTFVAPEEQAVILETTPEPESDLEEEFGEEPFLIHKETEVLEPAEENKEEPVIEIFQQSEPIEKAPEPQKPEKILSLNEMLSGKKEQNNAAGFKPIADLKASISLNDKMIFIKELFNGYNLAYSEAIEILNRFDSFEAADNFLMKNYAEKNNWAQKQDTVDRLYEILNRKFKS